MIDAGRLQRAVWLEVQPGPDSQRAGDGEVVDALRQLVPNPRRFPAKRRRGAA